MKYTYQYKACPTTQQKLELNLWLRICRFWYNRQLGDRFDWWECNRSPIDACPLVTPIPVLREKPNYYSQKKYLPELKKQPVKVQWSGEQLDFSRVPANTLQEVCKRVDKAFERFIAGDSTGKRSGKPRFKSESRFRSFVVEGAGVELNSCSIGGKYLYIKVPKIGLIKIRSHRHTPNGAILKQLQFIKKNDGWFVFFQILGHIAEKAGAIVVAKNPAYSSQLLSYRDSEAVASLRASEFIFTDRSIREYWDDVEKLLIDRDINAAINIKRVGLGVFPTLKRRKGGVVIASSMTDATSKEVLRILRNT